MSYEHKTEKLILLLLMGNPCNILKRADFFICEFPFFISHLLIAPWWFQLIYNYTRALVEQKKELQHCSAGGNLF